MKILNDVPVSIGGKYLGFFIALACAIVVAYLAVPNSENGNGDIGGLSLFSLVGIIFFSIIFLIMIFSSFIIVNPNEKVVFSFLGKYRGTTEEEGFMFKNPFFNAQKVSLKINTIDTEKTKINDKEGIPLLVSLVVNYTVDKAAPFVYNSEDPKKLVSNTCESVLRNIVTQHAYDSDNDEEETLSKDSTNFSEKITKILNEKLATIGVKVTNANIANISYAPEIAQSMLQRQQAKKVGESRKEIVNAAVGTVTEAVKKIEESASVTFDETEKKRFLKDLMLVIVSDQAATPTISVSEK